MGRQEYRAVRSGLHPTEARVCTRTHHDTQVAAERLHGPTGQGAGSAGAEDGADHQRGPQVF